MTLEEINLIVTVEGGKKNSDLIKTHQAGWNSAIKQRWYLFEKHIASVLFGSYILAKNIPRKLEIVKKLKFNKKS